MAQESINLVISCKNFVDDTGAEPVSSGLVSIAGKRISYAGSAGEAPEFPNALVIDLPEATLLPGLIDMHTLPSYYWEETDSGTYTPSPENPEAHAPIIVALKASNYLHKALIVGHHHGAPTREEIDLAVTTPALC